MKSIEFTRKRVSNNIDKVVKFKLKVLKLLSAHFSRC